MRPLPLGSNRPHAMEALGDRRRERFDQIGLPILCSWPSFAGAFPPTPSDSNLGGNTCQGHPSSGRCLTADDTVSFERVSAGGIISKHPLPVSQSLAKHAPRCAMAEAGRGSRGRGRGKVGPWAGTADVAISCEEAAMGRTVEYAITRRHPAM